MASSRGRQPQLDGVRACAVLLVVWQHTTRPAGVIMHDAGAMGVVLFFVLSGFLITGLLLDARRDAELVGVSRGGVLRRFYIRRFLRIFPAYYAILTITWLLQDPNVRAYIGWLVLYGTNFKMAALGANIGLATPFWSLAVEEQFYLFWPFIVLFLSRKQLPWVLVGMTVLSLVTRTLVATTGAAEHTITMPTWSSLDGLAIGGMLALGHHGDERPRSLSRNLLWALGCGVVLVGVRAVLFDNRIGRTAYYGLWMFPWALVSVWVVDLAARDRLPKVFQWRALTWTGVISYGIYISHDSLMHAFGIGTRRGLDVFAFVSAVTLVVASISWVVFERPINEQKRRWPYVPKPQPSVADVEVRPATTATV